MGHSWNPRGMTVMQGCQAISPKGPHILIGEIYTHIPATYMSYCEQTHGTLGRVAKLWFPLASPSFHSCMCKLNDNMDLTI